MDINFIDEYDIGYYPYFQDKILMGACTPPDIEITETSPNLDKFQTVEELQKELRRVNYWFMKEALVYGYEKPSEATLDEKSGTIVATLFGKDDEIVSKIPDSVNIVRIGNPLGVQKIVLSGGKDITSYKDMFKGKANIEMVDLSKLEIPTRAIDAESMFNSCLYLKTLIMPEAGKLRIRNARHMFSSCNYLTSMDPRWFDMGECVNLSNMFFGCTSLKFLDLTSWSTGKVVQMDSLFGQCSNLREVNLTGLNNDSLQNVRYLFRQCKQLEKIHINNNGLLNKPGLDVTGLFKDCNALVSIDLSILNGTETKSIEELFCGCYNLKEIDLSMVDLGDVTKLTKAFKGCSRLSIINLGNTLSNKKVKTMRSMTDGCMMLERIICGKSFDPDKVKNRDGRNSLIYDFYEDSPAGAGGKT